MNILFLTYDVPWPLDAGGKVRAYHLIRLLAKKHRVSLLTFYRREEQLKSIQPLGDMCERIIPVKRNSLYSIRTLSFSLVKPYPAALYYDPHVARVLLDTLTMRTYDAVHFESFYTSPYIDFVTSVPTILGTENIEWRIYDEFVRARLPRVLHTPASWEVMRMKLFEKQTWKTADACIAVSPQNSREIEDVVHNPVPVVANGIDTGYFRFRKTSSNTNTIVFVGNYSYIQNTDSVQLIIDKVLPRISSTSTFIIAGKHPPSDIRLLDGKKVGNISIRVMPDVADIRDIYSLASLMLAPIRVGSGTQFKMLEAMACGIPVVTNAKGIEGIPAAHEKEAYIADSAEDMAHAVDILLNSPEKRAHIALSAHDMIERNFSWDAIGIKLERVYAEL